MLQFKEYIEYFSGQGAEVFLSALNLGHLVLSSIPIEKEDPALAKYVAEKYGLQDRGPFSVYRYFRHQALSAAFFHSARSAYQLAYGFYRPGELLVDSEFSRYPESVGDRFVRKFSLTYQPLPELKIGWGLAEKAISVWAKTEKIEVGGRKGDFNLSVDQDFGWKDGYGSHIELYDANSRTYSRSSQTGRTCYTLLIREDGMAVPQGLVEDMPLYEDIPLPEILIP